MRLTVYRVEAKYQGFQERLRYAVDKAEISQKEVRRLTGELQPMRELPGSSEEGDEDNTLIRKAKEGEAL